MSDPIDRQALIKSFEDELAEAKDFRDYFVKLPNTVFEQSLCNEAVKAWKLGIGIARHMPTIDAVPRQKYEEDMENAFAHGYTDAESKYRKMIADGELVELPTVKEHRDEAWEMFSLITSVWYGKQYYFMQDNGLVYSRKSHLTMTKGDALDEFLKEIGSDA